MQKRQACLFLCSNWKSRYQPNISIIFRRMASVKFHIRRDRRSYLTPFCGSPSRRHSDTTSRSTKKIKTNHRAIFHQQLQIIIFQKICVGKSTEIKATVNISKQWWKHRLYHRPHRSPLFIWWWHTEVRIGKRLSLTRVCCFCWDKKEKRVCLCRLLLEISLPPEWAWRSCGRAQIKPKLSKRRRFESSTV